MCHRAVCAFVVLFAAPMAAVQAKDGGPFVGVGLGSSTVQLQLDDVSVGALDFDGDDTAWKVFGGIRLARFFAIEGGFVDFGTPDDTLLGVDVETDFTGVDLFADLIAPLGPVDLFAKAGVIAWDAEARVSAGGLSEVASDDGSDFAWGVGVGASFGSFGLRGEWEQFEIANVDEVSLVSISFVYTF